jgi:hypothetical protein
MNAHAKSRAAIAHHGRTIHWMWWPAIGGLAVGIGGWLQPGAGITSIANTASIRSSGTASTK